MAKGQMRSNKEKKKPKADKNLKKGGAAPVNPFAAGKTPAGQSPNSTRNNAVAALQGGQRRVAPCPPLLLGDLVGTRSLSSGAHSRDPWLCPPYSYASRRRNLRPRHGPAGVVAKIHLLVENRF